MNQRNRRESRLVGAASTLTRYRRYFTAWLAGATLLAATVAGAHFDRAVLYEKASAYNVIVVTEEEGGVRALRFGRNGVRQSAVKPGVPDHLELPYAKVALTGLALADKLDRFLVVGLGGGSLPMFLRKYYPGARIDAVDIDPAVVDVAKAFFGFREDPRMRAHVADARQFIETVQEPYDVIFLDAFGPDSIPSQLTTQEFLLAVRQAVMPDGVVVGNVWGRNVNPLYDAMVRTYQEVFDQLFVLDVRGAANKILLALPRKRPMNREVLTKLARATSAARRLPFDLGNTVEYGFSHAPARTEHHAVLRDRNIEQHKLKSISR